MDRMWFLMQSYTIADEIKTGDAFKRLVALKKQIDNDCSEEIKAFKYEEERYNDVIQYGTYHPDYKTVTLAFSQAKTKLYTHPLVKEYREIEKIIQQELDAFSRELAKAVSDHATAPNDLGLLKGVGCHHG